MGGAYFCPLECVREPVSHWARVTRVTRGARGARLGGLVKVVGGVSAAAATSHTGPSLRPSRGRLVVLSVGCGSSSGCEGTWATAARLA